MTAEFLSRMLSPGWRCPACDCTLAEHPDVVVPPDRPYRKGPRPEPESCPECGVPMGSCSSSWPPPIEYIEERLRLNLPPSKPRQTMPRLERHPTTAGLARGGWMALEHLRAAGLPVGELEENAVRDAVKRRRQEQREQRREGRGRDGGRWAA